MEEGRICSREVLSPSRLEAGQCCTLEERGGIIGGAIWS